MGFRPGPLLAAFGAGARSLEASNEKRNAKRQAVEAARIAAEERARKRTLEEVLATRQTASHDREMREGGYIPEAEAGPDGQYKVEGRQIDAMLGAMSTSGIGAPRLLEDVITPERYGKSAGGYRYDKQSDPARKSRADVAKAERDLKAPEKSPEPLVPVMRNGKKVYETRSTAVGQEVPSTPEDAPDYKPLLSQFNSDPIVKNSAAVVEAYKKVRGAATNPSPAGDMSLVFGYMKMLDPGSTVREGEYANAQNAASVPDRVRNTYNKALAGEMLNPDQRSDFLNQARLIAQSQRELVKSVRDRYTGIATRNGIDPRNVVYDPFDGVLDEPPSDPAAWLRSRRGQR